MVFSTLACKNNKQERTRGRRFPWLAMVALCLVPLAPARASNPAFQIDHAGTTLDGDVYHLNANISYRFSQDALEALRNGVPLTIQLDIQVYHQRWWWWDKDLASLVQRYQLQYHALTKRYIVRNLNSGGQHSYSTLGGALHALGDIRKLPILDKNLVSADTSYKVRARVHLDIEALPAPLRPLAYISSGWRLGSKWYTWSLKR